MFYLFLIHEATKDGKILYHLYPFPKTPFYDHHDYCLSLLHGTFYLFLHLSILHETPYLIFLGCSVSRFSFSNTYRFAANNKDPSASVGMTIREYCYPHHFQASPIIWLRRSRHLNSLNPEPWSLEADNNHLPFIWILIS